MRKEQRTKKKQKTMGYMENFMGRENHEVHEILISKGKKARFPLENFKGWKNDPSSMDTPAYKNIPLFANRHIIL